VAHALGIDVGSTNAKVTLVADDGRLVGRASRPIPMVRSGDVAEQDPRRLWEAVADAIRELTSAHPAEAGDVVAIGTCSQYSSIVPVDASGEPVGALILYLDTRGTDRCFEIMERHEDAFMAWIEHHGIPPIGSGLSLGHMLHLQHDQPEVHEKTAAWLEVMDLVTLRLTGEVAATQSTMFTGQLCDNRTLGVTSYDPDLVSMSGVDADRLPPLVAPDAVVGELLPAMAEQLGLPSGVVVAAGMNDSHAGAFATGAFAAGTTGLSIGTTAVLLDTIDHMAVDLDHEVLSMPSPLAGHYLVWAENGMAGKSVEHVLGELVHATDALGDHGSENPFGALNAALAATEPGANGVLFLPWLTGSFSPSADRSVRGGFLNVSLDARRIDLVRSAVEGTAHNLRWLLPFVEQFAGRAGDRIVFGGGAARSGMWAQVVADVLEKPVDTLTAPDHAVARAAGLVGLQRVGALPPGDLSDLVEVESSYEPDPSVADLYAARQAQFEAAFEALRPIHQALNP
jgi:xylulokinase